MNGNTSSVIPESWALPQALRDEVGAFASRQRELSFEGHLLLVLHQLPQPGIPERLSILLWRSPDGHWQGLCESPTGGDPDLGDAKAIMGRLLREYNARIDELEAAFAQADGARQLFAILHDTMPVMRAMKNMATTLHMARERLPKSRELLVWREEAHGAERAVELLYEEARAALDFTIAEEAEVQSQANLEMARAANRLNTVVAFFLPITAFGALLGMNLNSGFEGAGPWLFWSIFVVGLACGGIVTSIVLRKRALPHLRPIARWRKTTSQKSQ